MRATRGWWWVVAVASTITSCTSTESVAPVVPPAARSDTSTIWLQPRPANSEGEMEAAIPCPATVRRISFPWDDRIWDTNVPGGLRRTWNRGERAGYKALDLTGNVKARIDLVGLSGQKASASEIVVTCKIYFIPPIVFMEYWEPIDFRREAEDDWSDGCGGGEDDGDEEWATVKISPIFDPTDVRSVAELDRQVARSCGGGDTDYGDDIICWDEYLTLEISYDGGLTWHVLWSDWGRVCDLAA